MEESQAPHKKRLSLGLLASFLRESLIPSSTPGRAALLGAMVGVSLVCLYIVPTVYVPGIGGIAISPLLALAAAVPGAILAILVFWLHKLLSSQVTSGIIGLSAGLLIVLGVLGYPAMFGGLIIIAVVPLLSLLAASVARVIGQRHRKITLSRLVSLALVLLLLGTGVWGIAWFNHGGTNQHLVTWQASSPVTLANHLASPAAAGPFEVEQLFYGSGRDARRPEYGQGVSLVTESVDVTPFLPEFSSFRLAQRARYWGFDLNESPLNGRVWYPVGEGPFPLVLIVHGNHVMTEFSDPGYAYLGELLASRGYITVSVDQNFLNGSPFGGGFTGPENAARGWLLLEHLRVWREWQGQSTNPFYQKVDLDNVALIGHSRGGEAVAIAAALNRLPSYPDDANIQFDYGFGIQSVIAFAPSDSFYNPAGRPVTLEDVNYLVFHGAHDADVSIFMGNRQFERTDFSGESYRYKSAVYIYQANHSFFNSVWGELDWPLPFGKLMNRKALMPGEEQRQIAKVYIAAFLDSTIKGDLDYLPLFQDSQNGAGWLPDTIIVSRFQDSTFRVISDFEEDIDLTSTTVPGGVQAGHNLVTWKESLLSLRSRSMDQANSVVMLAWDEAEQGGIPSYQISLPKDLPGNWGVSTQDFLVFSWADLGQGADPVPDLSITLSTSAGEAASVKLSDFSQVVPPLTIRHTKLGLVEKMVFDPVEPVLRTCHIPLSAFVAVNGKFDPSELAEIRFVFDQSPRGSVMLDNIGLSSQIWHR